MLSDPKLDILIWFIYPKPTFSNITSGHQLVKTRCYSPAPRKVPEYL